MTSTRRLPNYLRAHRKRMGLTQKDVAFVLGYISGTKISRHERYLREPCLRTALAYAALFQVPARELFAGIHEQVAAEVEKRARLLAAQMTERRKGPASRSCSPDDL